MVYANRHCSESVLTLLKVKSLRYQHGLRNGITLCKLHKCKQNHSLRQLTSKQTPVLCFLNLKKSSSSQIWIYIPEAE